MGCNEHKLGREAVKEVIGHTDPADQAGITVRYEGTFSPAVLFVGAPNTSTGTSRLIYHG